jgi:peptide/nickel transport system permease protein
MPSAARAVIRRGLMLLIAYLATIVLVAAVMEGTGYAQKLYEAIVRESVSAEIQAIARARAGQTLSPTELEELRSKLTFYYSVMYGLIDEQGNPIPPYLRMWNLVKNSLILNFGYTTKDSVAQLANRLPPVPVIELIASVLPRTIIMITIADLITVAIALKLGPRVAYRHGSLIDKAVIFYFALFNAIPLWWFAMLLIALFAFQLRIFPPSLRGVLVCINNFWNNPVNNFLNIVYYATLPILTIVIAGLGGWLYGIRAMVLRVIREDFVTVAKAKGLPEKEITSKYVLRVALPPVITSVILTLAGSLGGFIITESIFDWPGMGTLYYLAITSGDTNTVMGLFVITVGVYVLARFILELIYIVLDPRIRVR